MSSQSPGTPTETVSGQFWDSNLGVPGKCAIWMQLPRGVAENTIWGKVVASPESGLWWVLCVKVPTAYPNTQGCSRMWTNHFVVCFGCRFKLDLLVPPSPNFPQLHIVEPSSGFTSRLGSASKLLKTFNNLPHLNILDATFKNWDYYTCLCWYGSQSGILPIINDLFVIDY